MAHDWNTADAWDNYVLTVRNKRSGQGGWLTGYGRSQWHQVQRHPTLGWDVPAGDTPYFFIYRAERLTTLFPAILTGHRILILGSGIGYFVEAMKDAGFASTYGMEGSTYLRGRLAAEARPDVITIEKTLGANTLNEIQTEMISKTGAATFRWIITDTVLERVSNPQSTFLRDWGPLFLEGGVPESAIINLTIPLLFHQDPEGNLIPASQDPEYFFRSLADSQDLVPNQTVVSTYGSWEIYV